MWIQHIFGVINIFYLSFFFSLFLFFLSFGVYFKEKIKSPAFSWLLLYLFIYFCGFNYITYIYAEDIIFFFSFWIQENFIVRDPNDWVWSLINLSFFLSLIFFIIYYIYIINILFKDIFFKHQYLLFQLLILIINYFLLFSFIFLILDFIFAGLNSFNDNQRIPFELQLDIDNFLNFVLGTYWDFFFSSIFIQIFLFIYFWQNLNTDFLKNKIIVNFILTVIIFDLYYWFGGQNILQDFFFIGSIFICIEFLFWLLIFFSTLVKYKK